MNIVSAIDDDTVRITEYINILWHDVYGVCKCCEIVIRLSFIAVDIAGSKLYARSNLQRKTTESVHCAITGPCLRATGKMRICGLNNV